MLNRGCLWIAFLLGVSNAVLLSQLDCDLQLGLQLFVKSLGWESAPPDLLKFGRKLPPQEKESACLKVSFTNEVQGKCHWSSLQSVEKVFYGSRGSYTKSASSSAALLLIFVIFFNCPSPPWKCHQNAMQKWKTTPLRWEHEIQTHYYYLRSRPHRTIIKSFYLWRVSGRPALSVQAAWVCCLKVSGFIFRRWSSSVQEELRRQLPLFIYWEEAVEVNQPPVQDTVRPGCLPCGRILIMWDP